MSLLNKKSIECQINEDDIVFFLHIPKTAGTTLISILDSFFDYDTIYPEQLWHNLLKNRPTDFSRFRLIRGHFGYGLCRLLPKKPVFMTMLRDPVDRHISGIEHKIRDPDPRFKQKSEMKNKSFLEILNDPESPGFEDLQCRQIGLNPDILSITKSWEQKDLAYFKYPKVLHMASKEVSRVKLLQDAKTRLSEFEFVGISERLEDSMYLLFFTFGWRPIHNIWKLNVTPKKIRKTDLPKETLNRILESNQLDSKLYEFGKELFENRFNSMMKYLNNHYYESKYSKFSFQKSLLLMLEKHYEKQITDSRQTRVKKIDYDFQQKMFGSGWYWREFITENKMAYRWTGPETKSTIDFFLAKDDDLIIQFRVMRTIIPDVLKSLKFQVNDHPIEIKKLDEKSGSTVFEGFIPKSALMNKQHFSRLCFEIDRTINPHEINSLDPTDRPLGIAVDRIKIMPSKEYDKTKDRIEIKPIPVFSKKNLLWNANSAIMRIGEKFRSHKK